MGTYLLGTGTLGWVPGVGLGVFALKISILNFYLPHVDVGQACSVFLPLIPIWMDVFLFFNSVVVGLPSTQF